MKLLWLCVWRIIHTPIFSWLPIKHHVVLLAKKDLYALDFTPVGKNYLKLLLGKNVDGEIRLRRVNATINETERILSLLETCERVRPEELKELWTGWNQTMNMYHHNCQHFSEFVKKRLD